MKTHTLYDGSITHKRFGPKKHAFRYKFFMLDLNPKALESLQTPLFSLERFNLFSFFAKDHFGKNPDFLQNAYALLQHYHFPTNQEMRFLTLPRIANFVFNPISVLLLLKDEQPTHLLAEVHNYNGGRVIYPAKLQKDDKGGFYAQVQKQMYVSPFLGRTGAYNFFLDYTKEHVVLKIVLEENEKILEASFHAKALTFSTKNLLKLFFKHTFLTLFVVTRTLWQSFLLFKKGIPFQRVSEADTKRRH